jgi:hypothetical protein
MGFLLLALAIGAPLQAQGGRPGQPPAGPGEIRGAIRDADTGSPLGFSAIEVFNGGDARVAGAIATAEGAFRIEGLMPGTYRLRVTLIGYGTHDSEPVAITPAAPRVNLGEIQLRRSAIALESVEVTAESQVMIAPDRNIYRARDIAPAAATATDVLETVPSVHVDADGRLSLRGNENLVVQINGRPTPIRGAQLAAYLRQLPASTIERVEVIPNPSARQDPEGMAGILNIVMKQTVDLGRSGGFMLAGATSGRLAARPTPATRRAPSRPSPRTATARTSATSWASTTGPASARTACRSGSRSRTSTAQRQQRAQLQPQPGEPAELPARALRHGHAERA